MSSFEILKDLFFIERGYLNGNHIVYRALAPIIIDTGYLGDFDITGRMMSDLGVDISQTELIINTHTHSDHIGGNKTIQEMSGCDIALHKLGKYYIDSRDDWSTWWRYYDHEADFFKCTQALEDGDVVSVGPHEFQVIHTPGHASDGIVLYNKKEKVLISSDTLWEYDVATITIRVEGSTAVFRFLESLEKLESLDVRSVFPGHGPVFTDFKGALSRSKNKINRYINHREETGVDLLKKIFVYTLLMHKEVNEENFFDQLMETYWFRETVDLFFHGEYQLKYKEVMTAFFDRGIFYRKNGNIFTTIKP